MTFLQLFLRIVYLHVFVFFLLLHADLLRLVFWSFMRNLFRRFFSCGLLIEVYVYLSLQQGSLVMLDTFLSGWWVWLNIKFLYGEPDIIESFLSGSESGDMVTVKLCMFKHIRFWSISKITWKNHSWFVYTIRK